MKINTAFTTLALCAVADAFSRHEGDGGRKLAKGENEEQAIETKTVTTTNLRRQLGMGMGKKSKSSKSKSSHYYYPEPSGKGYYEEPSGKGKGYYYGKGGSSKGKKSKKGGKAPKGKGKGGGYSGKGYDYGSGKGKGYDYGSGKGKGYDYGSGKGKGYDYGSGKGKGYDYGSGKGKGYDYGSGKGKGYDYGSGKGGPTTGKGKGGSVYAPMDCHAIDVTFYKSELLDNFISGPKKSGGFDNVNFYSSVTGEQLGFYSDWSQELDTGDCVGTGAFSFDGEPNYQNQISVSFTCFGALNAITGGTGDYGCASGFEAFVEDTDEIITSTLNLCGPLCPYVAPYY